MLAFERLNLDFFDVQAIFLDESIQGLASRAVMPIAIDRLSFQCTSDGAKGEQHQWVWKAISGLPRY